MKATVMELKEKLYEAEDRLDDLLDENGANARKIARQRMRVQSIKDEMHRKIQF